MTTETRAQRVAPTTIEVDGNEVQVLGTATVTCEYMGLCRNTTERATRHPILVSVPCCERCAKRFGLVRDLFMYQTNDGIMVTATPVPLA